MKQEIYRETFDESAGGWVGWISNAGGPARLERANSTIVSRSPWWVDYNHAPPGAGYLHLLFALQTRPHFKLDPVLRARGGTNRFIEGGFPTDFTNARFSLRLRGEVNLRGAQMVLHCQSRIGNVFVNQTLTGQPFHITPQWSEQTIQLIPDPMQWKCLGTRHDRTDFYGSADISSVLRDLNGNIILILYPLNISPTDSKIVNPHEMRAGEDYEIDHSLLPSGHVMVDEVRIEFA